MSALRAVVLAFALSALLAASGWADPPPITDQVAAALALPDESAVILDGVFVTSVSDGYAAVRDMWAHGPSILVSTDAAVHSSWTVKITGQMATTDGQRVLVASCVQLYVNSENGAAAPPFPPYLLRTWVGISLVDVPAVSQQRGLDLSLNTLEVTTEEFDGSIGSAKTHDGDHLTLYGKVVTAVFYTPGTTDIAAFYIQEPCTGGAGIRVVQEYASVHNGEIVDVAGTVVCDEGGAECYFAATETDHEGWASRPNPIGTAQHFTAAGAYGVQPALYKKTSDSSPGVGVNLLGTRVRVWGRVTWINSAGTECCIDDGTGMESVIDNVTRCGIRLIGSTDYPMSYQVGDYVFPATGILGAEIAGGKPVPVLRLPCSDLHPVIHVRPSPSGDDNNTGFDWTHAKATIHGALNAASEGQEVWVATGWYRQAAGNLTLPHGVGLYGGFAGTETAMEQRNWRTNNTAIQVSFYCMESPPEAGPGFTVDGFTLSSAGFPYPINCSYGDSISIRHNTIETHTGIHVEPVDSSQHITISDNWIKGDDGVGVDCYGAAARDSVVIANNTFTNNASVSNSRCAIAVNGSSPKIANNIISGNQYGVCDFSGSGAPLLRNNCVFGASTAYVLGPGADNSGGMLSDPLLVGVHISPDSPCLDAGLPGTTAPGEKDLDAQARIYGSQVDIGADESIGNRLRAVTLTPDNVLAIPPTSATLTATVHDEPGQQTVSACRVDFSVRNGMITAIGGSTVSPPATTAWATTGSNGTLSVTVLATAGKTAIVTARVASGDGDESTAQAVIFGAVFKMGFLYYQCAPYVPGESRDELENYFTRLDTAYDAITYARVDSPWQSIDSSFNTVFLIMPALGLPTSEISAISASFSSFVQSGRNKRIVLVGEFGSGFSAYNGLLNAVAQQVGMKSDLFSQSSRVYDSPGTDPCSTYCRVEAAHYLMPGVVGLWDAASDYFTDGWQTYARPVAYLKDAPQEPWIVEQDTNTAGSRIAIHDSSMFKCWFNDDFDTVPDKNFRFVRNLCTIFPD